MSWRLVVEESELGSIHGALLKSTTHATQISWPFEAHYCTLILQISKKSPTTFCMKTTEPRSSARVWITAPSMISLHYSWYQTDILCSAQDSSINPEDLASQSV